jgi:hypothetical protein
MERDGADSRTDGQQMDERTNRKTDGWTNGKTGKRADGQTNGKTGRRTVRWKNRWMENGMTDKKMDKWVNG